MTAAKIACSYPDALPVAAYRAQIVSLLRGRNVVIVCGDTGSGKTTQLPKMAFEALWREGERPPRIACTQPRRIAAVTVAARVAAELREQPGETAGWQHRFGRKLSERTCIKFMTDGVLLAETRSDPMLRAYDAIVIDEAHERSLNIDFLLGILKRILARRKDLRVIVSSATLDHEKFAAFFGGAPSVLVPGRTYPVEMRWMPPPDEEREIDVPRAVAAAVRTLPPDGDILAFLPGERDIREAAKHLASVFTRDETLPLLASLPAGEIERAFKPCARRKIVLATNVAETSLTIPGIKAVIDTGLARVPRFVHRTQVQRLQVEPVSQASARQRAGRCGRTAPGICVRLYSEEDFAARPQYTPPEILRTSLAGVLLTMLDLGLGAIEDFPFIDPPKGTMVREGWRELLELGAISRDGRDGPPRLTATGRKLARFPLEPRLARMLLAASTLATLPSAIPVVAAMACDDPRRRPAEEREKADAAHTKFRVKGSDFLGTLKLWKWWDDAAQTLSQTKLRELAKKNYLSFPRLREWRGIARQLRELCASMRLDVASDNGGPDSLHKALMSGLLGRIGRYDSEEREYRGTHGTRFALHPSGVLRKEKGAPEWIVAGELVDTSRLFARNCAIIDSRWIEPVAKDVCKYSWHDPSWDAGSGYVRALERVTLYGLVIVEGRRRDYSRIDPVETRRLFVLHALVFGEYPRPPEKVRAVIETIDAARRRADRLRKAQLFDIDAVCARLDAIIPPDILSTPALDKWLRFAPAAETARFRLDRDEWLPPLDAEDAAYPEIVKVGGATLYLSYANNPGDPATDGITCTVSKRNAAALALWRSDRLVPGFLPEKISMLLASLPASLRRAVGPLDEAVAILTPMVEAADGPLSEALRRAAASRFAVRIPPGALENARLPPHLSVRFVIPGVCDTRNLDEALAAAGVASRGLSQSVPAGGGTGVKRFSWDFGAIRPAPGCWTALHDEGDGVTLRMFRERAAALASHRDGVARLAFLAEGTRLAKTVERALKSLDIAAALFFNTLKYPAAQAAADAAFAALREAAVDAAGAQNILDADAFRAMLARGWNAAAAKTAETAKLLPQALSLAAEAAADAAALEHGVPTRCSRARRPDASLSISGTGFQPVVGETASDIAVQTAWLMFPGFLQSLPPGVLAHYPRYFKAQKIRIARARVSPSGDRAKMARFEPYWEQYAAALKNPRADRAALAKYRWALEEYRVSLFAQELKTAYPVSPERLSALFLAATGD